MPLVFSSTIAVFLAYPVQQLLNLGFVNEVTKIEELITTAETWAQLILDCSPTSIRTTKDVVMSGLSHADIEDAMSAKYDSVNNLFKSEDFIEGPLAFSEKRKPNWTGK